MTPSELRTDLSLTVDRLINAPPEHVFQAWLNPEMLQRFMLPGPDMSLPVAKIDAREGGRFELVMRAGEDDMPHSGTYKTITPHSQIVFTWESAWSPAQSLVTLDFQPEASGTRLTLTHDTFYDEEKRDNHRMGWAAILDKLFDITEKDS